MISTQILDYIRQQLVAGISKEEISKSLIASGWQVSDINEAFASLAGRQPPAPSPNVQTLPITVPILIRMVSSIIRIASVLLLLAGVPALLLFVIPAGLPFADNGLNLAGAFWGVFAIFSAVIGFKVAKSLLLLQRKALWNTLLLFLIYSVAPVSYILSVGEIYSHSPTQDWTFYYNYPTFVSSTYASATLLFITILIAGILYSQRLKFSVASSTLLEHLFRGLAVLYIGVAVYFSVTQVFYPLLFPKAHFQSEGEIACTQNSDCASFLPKGGGSSQEFKGVCKPLPGAYGATAGTFCQSERVYPFGAATTDGLMLSATPSAPLYGGDPKVSDAGNIWWTFSMKSTKSTLLAANAKIRVYVTHPDGTTEAHDVAPFPGIAVGERPLSIGNGITEIGNGYFHFAVPSDELRQWFAKPGVYQVSWEIGGARSQPQNIEITAS